MTNRCIVLMACVFLLSVTSLALAKGKGKQDADDRAPGWDKGEKSGWQSDVPPGMEKEAIEAESAGKSGKERKKEGEKGSGKGKKEGIIEEEAHEANDDENEVVEDVEEDTREAEEEKPQLEEDRPGKGKDKQRNRSVEDE